jgi:D-glycero-alpha-D-manno-heptose 1-phosphate guanylyltransferase
MALIRGRPFLEYQLTYLKQQGIQNVILAVGYLAEKIQNHFGNTWSGISIQYSRETEALGTGGAIIKALKLAPEQDGIFCLNGDTYFPIALDRMYLAHKSNLAVLSIAVFENTIPGRYSLIGANDNGLITSINSVDDKFSSGGIYVFSSCVLSFLRSKEASNVSLESDLIPNFIAAGSRMFVYHEYCPFIDIGIPEDYQRAQTLII